MVDFNNETTVTRPKRDILQFMTIERYYNVIEVLEKYYFQENQGSVPVVKPVLQARIKTYYITLKDELEKCIKKEDTIQLKHIEEKIDNEDVDVNIEAFKIINSLLFNLGLLRFTDRKSYDPSDAWAEQEAKEE